MTSECVQLSPGQIVYQNTNCVTVSADQTFTLRVTAHSGDIPKNLDMMADCSLQLNDVDSDILPYMTGDELVFLEETDVDESTDQQKLKIKCKDEEIQITSVAVVDEVIHVFDENMSVTVPKKSDYHVLFTSMGESGLDDLQQEAGKLDMSNMMPDFGSLFSMGLRRRRLATGVDQVLVDVLIPFTISWDPTKVTDDDISANALSLYSSDSESVAFEKSDIASNAKNTMIRVQDDYILTLKNSGGKAADVELHYHYSEDEVMAGIHQMEDSMSAIGPMTSGLFGGLMGSLLGGGGLMGALLGDGNFMGDEDMFFDTQFDDAMTIPEAGKLAVPNVHKKLDAPVDIWEENAAETTFADQMATVGIVAVMMAAVVGIFVLLKKAFDSLKRDMRGFQDVDSEESGGASEGIRYQILADNTSFLSTVDEI